MLNLQVSQTRIRQDLEHLHNLVLGEIRFAADYEYATTALSLYRFTTNMVVLILVANLFEMFGPEQAGNDELFMGYRVGLLRRILS